MSPPRSRLDRVVVPRPERVRVLGASAGFGWIEARLLRDGWLAVLTPVDLAVYGFLCLAADRQGVSWYRQDRIRAALAISEAEVWQALARLEQLDLVAYQPFHPHASEGFRQVLTVPELGPPERFPRPGGTP